MPFLTHCPSQSLYYHGLDSVEKCFIAAPQHHIHNTQHSVQAASTLLSLSLSRVCVCVSEWVNSRLLVSLLPCPHLSTWHGRQDHYTCVYAGGPCEDGVPCILPGEKKERMKGHPPRTEPGTATLYLAFRVWINQGLNMKLRLVEGCSELSSLHE